MNKRAGIPITSLITATCLAINVYSLFYKDINPKPMAVVNLTTGLPLLLMIGLTLYKRDGKK